MSKQKIEEIIKEGFIDPLSFNLKLKGVPGLSEENISDLTKRYTRKYEKIGYRFSSRETPKPLKTSGV